MKRIKNFYKKGLTVLLAFALLTSNPMIGPQTAKAATVTGTIPAVTAPIAIATNPMTNKIYEANYVSGNVTVIDGMTNGTTTIATGTYPRAIAVNPETNKIYIANYGSSNVTIIDGNNNSTTTVAAGVSPYAIAVDPATNKIYVANSGSGNMTVINGTDLSTQTIAVGTSPYAVAVDSVTNKIYVANYGSNNVTVINGTDSSTQTVAVGSLPYAVAVNPITNKIYVANSGSSDVTVIDGVGLSTQTITAGVKPQAITINPVTNIIYVANFNSNNVTVIDGTDNSTISVVTGNKPQALAVNPATNKIYSANIGDNNVTVINGDDNSTVTVTAGSRPMAVAVNPATNRIYTANYDGNDVTVIDGDDNNAAALDVFCQAKDVAVNPVTNKIYIANCYDNKVTVVDRSNNSKATVSTGQYPQAVAVNPITNKIYVANCDSDNVTVIDGTDLSTQTVAVGEEPYDIAVNPATNKIYVTNHKSGSITMIDGADLSTQTLNTQTMISGGLVGTLPTAIAVNPATNKIYVGDYDSSFMTVIDGANFSKEVIQVGNGQIAIAVNPVTDKIYVGSFTFITVVDGNDGSTTIIDAVNDPEAIAVNPATNKIYAANFFNNTVTVIDGTDNSKAIVAAGECPDGIDVNPVTNEIYVAKFIYSNSVTVIDAQSEQPGRLTVSISPLPENLTDDTSPTFDLTAQSNYTPSSPSIRQIWYQMDTMTGKWVKALSAGVSVKVTLSELSRGTHTLYAFATDGMEATSVNTGYGTSSITGKMTAYSFTVLDTRPMITTQSLPDTALQDDYNVTVSAKFGLEPYTWSATDLPAGLSINTLTGLISGLAEESGIFHPTINVTDRDGIGTSKTFTISVYDAPDGNGTLSAAPASLDAGSKGNLLTFTYTPSGSGLYNGEITIQLPSGWTLPSTVPGSGGYVSAPVGTVSVSGSTIAISNIILPLSDTLDITYSGVTAPGGTGSDVLLVKQKTKEGGTLKALSTLPEIVVNSDNTDPTWPGDAALNIMGRTTNTITCEWPDASDNIGVAGYKIYINGSLEATVGESVNSYTASGLSQGVSYTFMVSTYDMAGNTTDGPSVAANTNTSMTITMGTIPEGETGIPYSFTLTAGGGTAPYIWAVSGPPSGLGIDAATGKISGTPSDAGVNSVTAALIDSEGQRVTIVFNIVVKNASMQITLDSLPAGTAGVVYSQTLTASGGDGHYTWLNKEIPDGLNLDSATGEINGRVQESGIYTVNIVLIDGSGNTTEKTYKLIINTETAKGKYTVTPDADSAYIIGSKNGIVTVTIEPGVTGYRFIAATVTPVVTHEGTETAVFTLTRGGIQIGLTAVKADFDYENHPTVGFNVKAGDIIKIYVVDDLSNAAESNPVLLQ